MHLSGVYGTVVIIAGLFSQVVGLSNTSPFVLLSESQRLRLGYDPNLGPAVMSMKSALESIVNDAAMSCEYDAYIFVKDPHVSERDVNSNTMPWLIHAAKKVRESVLFGTLLDGSNAEVDTIASELQQNIAKKCGAKEVKVNSDTGAFDHYADTKPRILSIDFSDSNKTPGEVDIILRDIVGRLPSANFLLTYRTTPVESAGASESDAKSNNPNMRSHAQSSAQNVVYSTGKPAVYATGQSGEQAGDSPYESVFRNYQFFSPGIFMALIAAGLGLSIMLIALNAVSSLKISIAAFEPRRQTVPRKS